MKKKIIFMVINMNVGGTEKALLNMIAEMPKKYDITILMLEKYGGFLNSIPDHVHIEYLNGYTKIKEQLTLPPIIVALQYIKKGKIIKAFYLMFFHLISKIMKERTPFFRYLLRDIHSLENEYDLAVAYAGPMDFISYFVVYKIKAKGKVQWIHFDVSKIGLNIHFANKIYKRFNKIYAVSNKGKSILSEMLPHFKDKIDSFPNLFSKDLVIKMAEEGTGFEDRFNGIRILTVGRLSKEKGQDLIIPVLAKLKEGGYNVRWYFVGEGNARQEYEKLIVEYEVEDSLCLLGAHPNPYPFMKQCDLYVQPSRHEGYCITLAEARCFDNPIVTTNFTGASEQITNEQTGLIVDFNEDQLYIAIKRFLDDEILRQTIKKNLLNEQIEQNNNHINKLYEIVDGFNKKLVLGE